MEKLVPRTVWILPNHYVVIRLKTEETLHFQSEAKANTCVLTIRARLLIKEIKKKDYRDFVE